MPEDNYNMAPQHPEQPATWPCLEQGIAPGGFQRSIPAWITLSWYTVHGHSTVNWELNMKNPGLPTRFTKS